MTETELIHNGWKAWDMFRPGQILWVNVKPNEWPKMYLYSHDAVSINGMTGEVTTHSRG